MNAFYPRHNKQYYFRYSLTNDRFIVTRLLRCETRMVRTRISANNFPPTGVFCVSNWFLTSWAPRNGRAKQAISWQYFIRASKSSNRYDASCVYLCVWDTNNFHYHFFFFLFLFRIMNRCVIDDDRSAVRSPRDRCRWTFLCSPVYVLFFFFFHTRVWA